MGDGQERTESATQKRKLDARKKGTVVRSTDLVNACCILALLITLPIAASSLGAGAIGSFKGSFESIPTDLSINRVVNFTASAMRPILPGISMIIATTLCVGLAVNFSQVGFVFSGQALMPNLNKLNPLTGFSRFLSRNSGFETLKGLGKATLFSLIAFGCIHSSWDQLNSLNQVPVSHALVVVGSVLRSLGLRIAFSWAALAGIDYFFQRQQIDRQLRMTKDEVKREMRESEISPEVRTARNIRRRRLMRRRLKEAVRSADVIVTNPTHYAIALKYEMGKSYAPIVVAKGMDYLAAKIREEAALAEIPLVPNPPLARALYKQCEIGDHVPRELFQAVAEVLAYVYRTLKKVPR